MSNVHRDRYVMTSTAFGRQIESSTLPSDIVGEQLAGVLARGVKLLGESVVCVHTVADGYVVEGRENSALIANDGSTVVSSINEAYADDEEDDEEGEDDDSDGEPEDDEPADDEEDDEEGEDDDVEESTMVSAHYRALAAALARTDVPRSVKQQAAESLASAFEGSPGFNAARFTRSAIYAKGGETEESRVDEAAIQRDAVDTIASTLASLDVSMRHKREIVGAVAGVLTEFAANFKRDRFIRATGLNPSQVQEEEPGAEEAFITYAAGGVQLVTESGARLLHVPCDTRDHIASVRAILQVEEQAKRFGLVHIEEDVMVNEGSIDELDMIEREWDAIDDLRAHVALVIERCTPDELERYGVSFRAFDEAVNDGDFELAEEIAEPLLEYKRMGQSARRQRIRSLRTGIPAAVKAGKVSRSEHRRDLVKRRRTYRTSAGMRSKAKRYAKRTQRYRARLRPLPGSKSESREVFARYTLDEAARKPSKKAKAAAVDAAFGKYFDRVQIPMLSIPKLYKEIEGIIDNMQDQDVEMPKLVAKYRVSESAADAKRAGYDRAMPRDVRAGRVCAKCEHLDGYANEFCGLFKFEIDNPDGDNCDRFKGTDESDTVSEARRSAVQRSQDTLIKGAKAHLDKRSAMEEKVRRSLIGYKPESGVVDDAKAKAIAEQMAKDGDITAHQVGEVTVMAQSLIGRLKRNESLEEAGDTIGALAGEVATFLLNRPNANAADLMARFRMSAAAAATIMAVAVKSMAANQGTDDYHKHVKAIGDALAQSNAFESQEGEQRRPFDEGRMEDLLRRAAAGEFEGAKTQTKYGPDDYVAHIGRQAIAAASSKRDLAATLKKAGLDPTDFRQIGTYESIDEGKRALEVGDRVVYGPDPRAKGFSMSDREIGTVKKIETTAHGDYATVVFPKGSGKASKSWLVDELTVVDEAQIDESAGMSKAQADDLYTFERKRRQDSTSRITDFERYAEVNASAWARKHSANNRARAQAYTVIMRALEGKPHGITDESIEEGAKPPYGSKGYREHIYTCREVYTSFPNCTLRAGHSGPHEMSGETCGGCGEPWPCSDSKRKEISGRERAKHFVGKRKLEGFPRKDEAEGDVEAVQTLCQTIYERAWKGAKARLAGKINDALKLEREVDALMKRVKPYGEWAIDAAEGIENDGVRDAHGDDESPRPFREVWREADVDLPESVDEAQDPAVKATSTRVKAYFKKNGFKEVRVKGSTGKSTFIDAWLSRFDPDNVHRTRDDVPPFPEDLRRKALQVIYGKDMGTSAGNISAHSMTLRAHEWNTLLDQVDGKSESLDEGRKTKYEGYTIEPDSDKGYYWIRMPNGDRMSDPAGDRETAKKWIHQHIAEVRERKARYGKKDESIDEASFDWTYTSEMTSAEVARRAKALGIPLTVKTKASRVDGGTRNRTITTITLKGDSIDTGDYDRYRDFRTDVTGQFDTSKNGKIVTLTGDVGHHRLERATLRVVHAAHEGGPNESTNERHVEIEVNVGDVVKIGFDRRDKNFWYQTRSGLKNSPSRPPAKRLDRSYAETKFRYMLRNDANVPNAEKLVDQLVAKIDESMDEASEDPALDAARARLDKELAALGFIIERKTDDGKWAIGARYQYIDGKSEISIASLRGPSPGSATALARDKYSTSAWANYGAIVVQQSKEKFSSKVAFKKGQKSPDDLVDEIVAYAKRWIGKIGTFHKLERINESLDEAAALPANGTITIPDPAHRGRAPLPGETTPTVDVPAFKLAKATVFAPGGFGAWVKREVSDLTLYRAPYAQYRDALRMQYRRKGARKLEAVVLHHKPQLVVFDRWNVDIDPESMFGDEQQHPSGATTSQSRRLSHDSGWDDEMMARVAASKFKPVLTITESAGHRVHEAQGKRDDYTVENVADGQYRITTPDGDRTVIRAANRGEIDEWIKQHKAEMRVWRSRTQQLSARRTTDEAQAVPALDDPIYTEKVKWPKFNGKVSPLSAGNTAAGKILASRLPGWTKADHLAAAAQHERQAKTRSDDWGNLADVAAQATWGRGYEATDYRVSGIASDEFSSEHKDQLRKASHEGDRHKAAAHAHRLAAKLRSTPKADESLDEGEKYAFSSASGGDYRGSTNSAQLARSVRANVMRAKTVKEIEHAIAQVRYFAASRSISKDDATALLKELRELPVDRSDESLDEAKLGRMLIELVGDEGEAVVKSIKAQGAQRWLQANAKLLARPLDKDQGHVEPDDATKHDVKVNGKTYCVYVGDDYVTVYATRAGVSEARMKVAGWTLELGRGAPVVERPNGDEFEVDHIEFDDIDALTVKSFDAFEIGGSERLHWKQVPTAVKKELLQWSAERGLSNESLDEGGSSTPPYVYELFNAAGGSVMSHPAGWRVANRGKNNPGYGKPNEANLQKLLDHYNASLDDGGANDQLSGAFGRDRVLAVGAIVRRNERKGQIMARVGKVPSRVDESTLFEKVIQCSVCGKRKEKHSGSDDEPYCYECDKKMEKERDRQHADARRHDRDESLDEGEAKGYEFIDSTKDGATKKHEWKTREAFLAGMSKLGHETTGDHAGRRTREELQGQPKFASVNGPMWGGNGVIRYESVEAYRQFSETIVDLPDGRAFNTTTGQIVESGEPIEEALRDGKVSTFNLVASSTLTQYDEQLLAKHRKNPRYAHSAYALSLYLEALDRAFEVVKGSEDSEDPAVLRKLIAALQDEFEPNFPPIKKVVKQIEAFITSGKKPTIVGQFKGPKSESLDEAARPSLGSTVHEVMKGWREATPASGSHQVVGFEVGFGTFQIDSRGKITTVERSKGGVPVTRDATSAQVREIEDSIARGFFQIENRPIRPGATMQRWVLHQATGNPLDSETVEGAIYTESEFEALDEAKRKKLKGVWRTTGRGHRVFIENGKITKGNPHVMRAVSKA